MRTRIRVLIAVLGVVVALVRRSPRPRSRRRRPSEPKLRRTRRPRSASSCSKRASTIDDCQKAPIPLLPAANEIIWGSLAFLVLLVAMWKFGVPAVKNMEQAREERIRNDLEGAEKARTEAEAEKAQYHAQLADARDEAGRIIEEARQAAEQVRRDLIARAEAEAAEIRDAGPGRHREPARRRRWPSCATDVAQLSIDLAERIVERNLDRDTQPPARRQLHRPGRGATRPMADRVDVYAQALLEIARAEGHLDEVEDELFRFARIVEGNDELRMALANPGLPARPARRDRRRAAREPRAARSRRAIASFIVGAGRGHDLPAIVDAVRRARGRRPASTRSPRSAPRSPLDDAQRAAARRGAVSRATGKHVEVKVIVDETVLGGIVATIGDTVIDGTVRHRLDQLKETHLNGRAHDRRRRHRGGPAQERRGLPARRSSASRSAGCSRSATASRASRAFPTRRSTSCSSSRAARSASR